MTVAPVPVNTAIAAIAALLDTKMPGVFQLTGPRDVAYVEVGNYLARELGADPNLVVPTSAYSAGMPKGSTPRNTTLDSQRAARQIRDRTSPMCWTRFRRFWASEKRDLRVRNYLAQNLLRLTISPKLPTEFTIHATRFRWLMRK